MGNADFSWMYLIGVENRYHPKSALIHVVPCLSSRQGKLDGSQPKYCNLCYQGQKQSLQGLCQEKNPYIVCSSPWNLQTERVWCVIWKLSSHITVHTSQGITRIISYNNKLPTAKRPLTVSPMWGICQLPWPMAWQCQLPRLVWGLDHPDTLTFEHNLAAPGTWDLGRLGPGWDSRIQKKVSYMGRDPKTKRKWWHVFFFSFSRLWRCFGVFFSPRFLFFLKGFHAQSLEFKKKPFYFFSLSLSLYTSFV